MLKQNGFLMLLLFVLFFLQENFCSAATRKIYFAATNNSNFAYDKTPLPNGMGYTLVCSVHIVNLSQTNQTITDMGMNHGSSKHTGGGAQRVDEDISHIRHEVRQWDGTASNFNVSWLKMDFLSAPPSYIPYNNENSISGTTNPTYTPLGYKPKILSPQTTLAANSPNSIALEPNSMVILMSKSWVPLDNMVNVDLDLVLNKKFYNFCSGFIQIRDNPAADQPKNGFVMATGELEYIADSPHNQPMSYGEPNGRTLITRLHGWGRCEASNKVRLTYSFGNIDLEGNTSTNQICAAAAYSVVGAKLWANSDCTVVETVDNKLTATFPMHVASTPLVINGGKPF